MFSWQSASLTMWNYGGVRTKIGRLNRAVLVGLRLVTVATLVFCLARPMLVLATVVPQENFLGILIDDSRSMKIVDEEKPRSDFVVEQFGSGGGELLSELTDRFKVRFFAGVHFQSLVGVCSYRCRVR